MKYGFGVDVGGTTVKIGLFEQAETLLERFEIPTHTENGGARILPEIAETIAGVLAKRGIAKEDVVVVPVYLFLFGDSGEVRVFLERRYEGIVHKLEIGVKFFLAGIEFAPGCIDTGTGLPGKGADDGKQTEVQVPRGFTGALQLGLCLRERHRRILYS